MIRKFFNFLNGVNNKNLQGGAEMKKVIIAVVIGAGIMLAGMFATKRLMIPVIPGSEEE